MVGPTRKAILVLLVGVVALSCAAILVRLCDAPALVIAAYRLGGAVILLLPVYLTTRPSPSMNLRPSTLPWLLLSGAFLGLHFLSWIAAVQRMPVAMAATLASTHPVFVATFGWALLGEPMRRKMAIGICLALLGTALMGVMGQARGGWSLEGSALAVGASLSFAGYMLVGRRLRRHVDLMAYVLPTYGTAALLLWGLTWASGLPTIGYDAGTYWMFLLLALVPTVIGHSAFNWALAHVSATVVAVSALGEPIGASILALLLLGETPHPLKLLAGAVILIGIYLTVRGEATRET